ncbi:response regulator transcription factor [bacterium]|nr:response regulator transcription factor [bacterium]
MKKAILIVEDDDDIRELVSHSLSREGFRVSEASAGAEALDSAKSDTPDLIILDLMLPDIDGLEVCKRLKADVSSKTIPIIMLTAKSEDTDIVVGLELGADDYITKPFSPRVLAARVKAVLRRKAKGTEGKGETIVVEDLVIDPSKYEVRLGQRPVELTRGEFEVLRFLASRRGLVFSRYQIVDAIHGEEYIVTDRAVDVQISGLRKKLGNYGKYIETVRGVGYRFRG